MYIHLYILYTLELVFDLLIYKHYFPSPFHLEPRQ